MTSVRASGDGTRASRGGYSTGPAFATIQDLHPAFLSYAERRAEAGERAMRTVEGHADRLQTFANFEHGGRLYGKLAGSKLRPADLSRFIRDCQGRGLSPGYINSIVLSVNAMLNGAARPVPDRGEGRPERVIAENPFNGVERPKNPAPARRYVGPGARRALCEFAALRALSRPIDSSAWRYDRLFVALIRFCEGTGCRPGKACRLEWRHIRWDESRAVLRGKVTARTGGMRVLPLAPSVVRMLRAIERLPGRHPDHVFTHLARDCRGRRDAGDLAGIPWNFHALDQKLRLWRIAAKAAGVAITGETGEPLTLYGLRRDMGADILRLTGSNAESAEVLGHSPEINARHYASFEAERTVELAKAVADRRWGPAEEPKSPRPAGCRGPLDARFEDGAGTAEVWDLLGIEPRAAEVDQVEVDPFDVRPPQVDADEIRLADLLGALEVLLEEFVRVEPGAAPLARDGAADQPAARRAEMEGGLAQIGAAEVDPLPFDVRQARRPQVGAAEVRLPHLRRSQEGVAEVGARQVGARERHAFEVAPREVGAREAGPLEPRGRELHPADDRAREVGPGEVCPGHPAVCQVDTPQARAREPGVAHVGTLQGRPVQHGALEVGRIEPGGIEAGALGVGPGEAHHAGRRPGVAPRAGTRP
jgi:integrase